MADEETISAVVGKGKRQRAHYFRKRGTIYGTLCGAYWVTEAGLESRGNTDWCHPCVRCEAIFKRQRRALMDELVRLSQEMSGYDSGRMSPAYGGRRHG